MNRHVCTKLSQSGAKLYACRKQKLMSETREIIRTTCPRDCYDACGMVVVKRQGEIVRVKGDLRHPVSRGELCGKCAVAYNGTLAAAGVRTYRNLMALVFATLGVYLLTNIRIAGEPLGFMFAFAIASICDSFTVYDVLSHYCS